MRLVFSAPTLLVQGPAALEATLQQAHRQLDLAAASLEPKVLLPLVLQLGPDALLDPQVTTQQVIFHGGHQPPACTMCGCFGP